MNASVYIYAWLAAFSFGCETIIGKLTSKYSIANPFLFIFVWSLFILIFTLPLASMQHAALPHQWGNVVVAAALYTAANILYILCIYKLEVSVLSPLVNLRTVFSLIFGLFLLGEALVTRQYLLIGAILVAGIFVNLDERLSARSLLQWPVALAIVTMMFLALMAVYINKAIAENDYWTVSLWICILSQIGLCSTVPFFIKDLKTTPVRQYWGVLLMAVAGLAGVLASNKAFSIDVSVSTTIMSLPFSLIMVIMLAHFIPQLLEKHTLKIYAVRCTAALIMFLAAIKLSS